MKSRKTMVNRFIILLIVFSSCGNGSKEKLELNSDYQYVMVKNDMFFIQRIKIFNSNGEVLYDQRLEPDKVGLNKVYLFQDYRTYVKNGGYELVKNDSLKKHIQIEIHSRDKKQIEIFENPFDITMSGSIILEPIKEPVP